MRWHALAWTLTLAVQLLGLTLMAGIWRWPYSYHRWRLGWGCLAAACVLVLLRSVVMLLRALGLLAPMAGLWTCADVVMPLVTSSVATLAIWHFRQIYGVTIPRITPAPVAIIVIDPQAVIVAWDSEAERLFGWSAEEAIGQPLASRLLADPTEMGPVHVWLTVTDDARVPPPQVVLLAQHRDGNRLPVQVTVSRVVLASGGTALRGAVCRLMPT